MPSKAPRPCAHPRCPELVTLGRFCDAHQKGEWKRGTSQRMRLHDVRADKKFYDSALWQKVRGMVLREEPWCRDCKNDGRATPAQMVDHIVPLGQGGPRVARDNLAPLCHQCHNRKRQKEMGVSRGDSAVVVVCGPPGSGKSTWVKQQAGADDLVVDLDLLSTALSTRGYDQRDVHERPSSHIAYAMAARDAVLNVLADRRNVRAWVITSGPKVEERDRLRQRFSASVYVLEVSATECLNRIGKDPSRAYQLEGMRDVVSRWWESYEPAPEDVRVR